MQLFKKKKEEEFFIKDQAKIAFILLTKYPRLRICVCHNLFDQLLHVLTPQPHKKTIQAALYVRNTSFVFDFLKKKKVLPLMS